MTERIPQSTSKLVVFKAFSSTDHVTESTGKTIVITISKNGGAFGNPNAGATNATEVSSGWYKVTLDTTDTDTLGPLGVRGAVSGIDDVGVLLEVVKATNAGFSALPDAAAEAAGGLVTRGTGTGQLSVTSGLVSLSSDFRIKKNTALAAFPFRMTDSADHVSPKTGLTVTGEVSKDGGAFGALTNAISEVASGWYKVDLAAADLNGDTVSLKFTATGADQLDITIVTQTE